VTVHRLWGTRRTGYSGGVQRVSASSAASPSWPGLTTMQSLAVASQFGVTLAIGVGLGLFAGRWLDGLLQSGIVMTLIGALVGLVSGIVSIVGLYRATLRKSALEWQAAQPISATRAGGSPAKRA